MAHVVQLTTHKISNQSKIKEFLFLLITLKVDEKNQRVLVVVASLNVLVVYGSGRLRKLFISKLEWSQRVYPRYLYELSAEVDS